MGAIAGLRGTATADWATDARPKNFREYILWRNPNGSAPMVALSARMKKVSTDDPEFAWYEEEKGIVRLQLNGAIGTTTATAITVESGALNLKIGDVLLVETAEDASYSAELLQVAVNPTVDTACNVTRGAAGSTAATIADNTYVTLIGSAEEEGTRAPKAVSRNPTKYYNYTQIYKDSYELTGTAEQTRFRTGDPVKNDKERKSHDHSTRMEYSWIFGKRHEGTGATKGKPQRYTGGCLFQLAAAVAAGNTHCMKIWTQAATTTTFLDAVYKVFDWSPVSGGSSDQRIVFAGNGYMNSLNKIVKADGSTSIRYDGIISVFGMRLQRYIIPQGELLFKTHPLFNIHGRYTNSCLVFNPQSFHYRPMRNRDTKFMDNVQDNDEDSRRGQWKTEGGLELHHLNTMQYQGNFSA